MIFLLAVAVAALTWLLVHPGAPAPLSFRQAERLLLGATPQQGRDRWTERLLGLVRFRPDPDGPLARDMALVGSSLSLADLYVYKALGVVGGLALAGLVAATGDTTIATVLAVIAVMLWQLPDARIRGEAKRIRAHVINRLPAFLQAVAMMTEAGMNLQPAIAAYAEQDQSPLGRELGRTMAEVQIGAPLSEGLLRMAIRCSVDDLYHAAAALIQASERGAAGLSDTCKELASEAWVRRRDSARELGQQASTKMMLPLILLVMPTLFLFMMGPAIFSMMKGF